MIFLKESYIIISGKYYKIIITKPRGNKYKAETIDQHIRSTVSLTGAIEKDTVLTFLILVKAEINQPLK